MMTLQEMQIAVCEKLSESIEIIADLPIGNNHPVKMSHVLGGSSSAHWKSTGKEINWPTEGLQVCHEAEKLLSVRCTENQNSERNRYAAYLVSKYGAFGCTMTTYEQRLEALCCVWFPERSEKGQR